MCDFCAEFGGKKAHDANAQKGINMHIANGIWHVNMVLHTKDHKPKRASNGDG